MNAVDADMVLVAKGGDRDIDPLCAVLGRLGLRKLDRPTRIAVLLAQFGGLSFQSSGMQPSLIAFFSASVLRCLGAATIVASMRPSRRGPGRRAQSEPACSGDARRLEDACRSRWRCTSQTRTLAQSSQEESWEEF